MILGCGDAFHLVSREIALCTTGLENYTEALGIVSYCFIFYAIKCLDKCFSTTFMGNLS